MPDATRKSSSAVPTSVSTPPSLAPAGESGDPAIHKLLADLETARSNGDTDGVKAVQQALADLGFSA